MLNLILAWLFMAILADGFWTGPDTPWYKHVLIVVTAPLWFGTACALLLHELGDTLYYWGA